MPKDLIESFKPGDELTGNLVDAIVRELQRLRKMNAAAPLAIDDGNGVGPPLIWMLDEDTIVPFKAPSGGVSAGSISGSSPGPQTFTPIMLIPAADGTFSTSSETMTNMGRHIMNVAIGADAIGWGCWYSGYLYPLTWDTC